MAGRGLVKNLKELDKYPWSGHATILGKRKNPLILPDKSSKHKKEKFFTPLNPTDVGHLTGAENPACPVKFEDHFTGVNPARPVGAKHRTGVQTQKFLAEKTIEDVLLHFGDTVKVSRRRYRQFVKNGIDQGKRPELQGGGLVRSAGGDKRGLLGRKKEERELWDERILGSGEFVENILADSGKIEGYKSLRKVSLSELVETVSIYLDVDKDEVLSGNRRQKNCHARGLISFLAVKSMGYKFNDVAEILGIHPVTAGRCAEKGKKLILCREISSA